MPLIILYAFSSVLSFFSFFERACFDSTFVVSHLFIFHPVYLLLIDMLIMLVLFLENSVIRLIGRFRAQYNLDIEIAGTPSIDLRYLVTYRIFDHSMQKTIRKSCFIINDLRYL